MIYRFTFFDLSRALKDQRTDVKRYIYHYLSSPNFLRNILMCKTEQKSVGFHEGVPNLRKLVLTIDCKLG